MTREELQAYLHSHIPISKGMGVTAVRADRDSVVLSAPLEPNINHRETVFGGSAASVAMLAGWSLMRIRLGAEGIDCRIVISKGSIDFGKAIESGFTATAKLEDPDDWKRFTGGYSRKGMARTRVAVLIESEAGRLARFTGEFAAVKYDQS